MDYSSSRAEGESLLFPPQHPDKQSARKAILHIVRRDPLLFGHNQSRWTLASIMESCQWLDVTTEGSLSRLLKRLDIRYKRGRDYIHSPDRFYEDKLSLMELCLLRAWYAPQRYVFLYQDEFSYYRQPTIDRAYEAVGHVQPLARRSTRSNTRFRGIGSLNAITGQVIYRQHYKIGLRQISAFYDDVCAAYPDAEEIYIAQDNWPVHFHPDILVRLQPQDFPWPPKVPANWPTHPSPAISHANLPIRLLCLPTYASWLNPIEKLWRWLRQDVLHLHRSSDEWQLLKQQVADFMAQFQCGSTDLLSYVGLLPY